MNITGKIIAAFFILTFSATIVSGNTLQSQVPLAQKGVMDLTAFDFSKNNTVMLDGMWEFYWKKLLTPKDFQKEQKPEMTDYLKVPGTWNNYKLQGRELEGDGYATYRMVIRTSLKEKQLLSIKTYDMATAFNLYMNGELVFSNGKVGKDKDNSIPQYLPGIAAFKIDSPEIEVILQVSNFHHRLGGPWYSIELGNDKIIRHKRTRQFLLELFLFGVLIIMGLYHLGIYALRHQNRSPLYFGIFCLVIALRTILVGERFAIFTIPDLNWEFANKMEYFTFFLGAPVFCLFLYSLFPKDFSKYVLYPLLVLTGLFCFTTLVTPTGIYSKTMQAYQIITLVASIYSTAVLIIASRRKRDGAVIFLIGWLFLFITIVNDLLYVNQVINTGNFVSLGLFVFIFSQAFMLSSLFSKAFFTIETLSEELSKTNVAYSRFVPHELLKFLDKKSIVDVKLGDHIQKTMTVLFSDIRGFTSISETMTPKENFNFLNSFLNRFGPIIRANNGFIDKYIGDAIMGLFPASAEDAVNSAVDMRMKLFEYNYHRGKQGYKAIDFGIGIHTGLLMLGTVGESERMEGTVIADAVNLSSRLEGLTKIYRTNIIISEDTLNDLEDPAMYHKRFLGTVQVKGKKKDIALYEIIDGDVKRNIALKLQTRDDFEKAIRLYIDSNFDEAIDIFQNIIGENPEDGTAEFYLEKSRYYRQNGIPPGWTGALVMDSK